MSSLVRSGDIPAHLMLLIYFVLFREAYLLRTWSYRGCLHMLETPLVTIGTSVQRWESWFWLPSFRKLRKSSGLISIQRSALKDIKFIRCDYGDCEIALPVELTKEIIKQIWSLQCQKAPREIIPMDELAPFWQNISYVIMVAILLNHIHPPSRSLNITHMHQRNTCSFRTQKEQSRSWFTRWRYLQDRYLEQWRAGLYSLYAYAVHRHTQTQWAFLRSI